MGGWGGDVAQLEEVWNWHAAEAGSTPPGVARDFSPSVGRLGADSLTESRHPCVNCIH